MTIGPREEVELAMQDIRRAIAVLEKAPAGVLADQHHDIAQVVENLQGLEWAAMCAA